MERDRTKVIDIVPHDMSVGPECEQDPLDPGLAAILPELNRRAPAVGTVTGTVLRREFDDLVEFLHTDPIPPSFPGSLARVYDSVVEADDRQIPVRIYEPEGLNRNPDVVVYFHGGGWVIGDLDSADPTTRALALGLRARVVSVDYRLAPEHPFPAAFDDCRAVVTWATTGIHRWLGVAGDSAGGNLAAAVAAELSDRIDGQLLFYPVLDPAQGQRSHVDLADGYLLTAAAVGYYWRTYLGDAQVNDPRITPAVLDDLRRVPPAVISTAGFDPLRDEGREYAARLVSAGVPTVYLPNTGLIHGWADHVNRVPAAAQALTEAITSFAGLRDATVHQREQIAARG